MPAARMSTPAICTSVSRRNGTSSESWPLANQTKFTHAHQIPKKAALNPITASAKRRSTMRWWSSDDAWETATTKHRS